MPFNPNVARTQFKKGQVPRNTKSLGHEYLTKDGYVMVSIAETNPHTGYERRFVLKHRHLWQLANGPLPEGTVLKCRDDTSNCDPANWFPVSRQLLPYLAGRWTLGYDAAEPELRPAILAAAELRHAARIKRRSQPGEDPA